LLIPKVIHSISDNISNSTNENYSNVREAPPDENSTDADSFVKFESNLQLKYGKNLPSMLLIPIVWFILPAKPNNKPKQYIFESE